VRQPGWFARRLPAGPGAPHRVLQDKV